jgi:hypothetical protein
MPRPLQSNHSALDAAGWRLLPFPDEHPRNAIGLYERDGLLAWLVCYREPHCNILRLEPATQAACEGPPGH